MQLDKHYKQGGELRHLRVSVDDYRSYIIRQLDGTSLVIGLPGAMFGRAEPNQDNEVRAPN